MGPGAEGGEDPMMQMLQQMMMGGGGGGMPGSGGNGAGDAGGLPPGLAAMLGGGGGGLGGMGPAPARPDDTYASVWKIVHAVFALALGVYMTSATAFSGSRFSRTESVQGEMGVRFFWAFATAELVLQSTRFFLERGRISQGGLLGTVGGLLPEPYKGYVALVSRYSSIYTTVVEDAMVVVFVLGVVAWWRGGLPS